MKLVVAAIGHLKSGPEKELAAEYEQRIPVLGRKAGISGLSISDWPESRASDMKLRLAEEAKLLWSVVPVASPVFVLDERGEALSSAVFAKLLEKEAALGAKQLTFMIGGARRACRRNAFQSFENIEFWPHDLAAPAGPRDAA